MDALSILQTKRRDERPHTKDELEWFIREYTAGNIPDYQMSAWLMAVCWKGMTPDETAILTKCMVDSGTRLQWNNGLPLVDKHSTGGVGDKVSLILAPLVASLGGYVPMMAGRGLGHTGGTIDKLQSIPGYRTDLSIEEFQSIVKDVGCSIVAANKDMCLADRKLYALRDVTATVTAIPLQTSSIMCKKIAENPNSLVLDVKYGRASFQSCVEEAEILAKSMISTGEANGLQPTTCFLTRMDSILGSCVGNWLEVQECIQILKTGKTESSLSDDLIALVVVESAQMVHHINPSESWDELVQRVYDTLKAGKAYPYFEKMVQAHGGDTTVLDLDNTQYPVSPKFSRTVTSPRAGYISKMNGLLIGELCVHLGAGRHKAEDDVDPIAGMQFFVKEGDCVGDGQNIVTVQTSISQEVLDRVCHTLLDSAIEISSSSSKRPTTTSPPSFCISHKVTSQYGMEEFQIPNCLQTKLP